MYIIIQSDKIENLTQGKQYTVIEEQGPIVTIKNDIDKIIPIARHAATEKVLLYNDKNEIINQIPLKDTSDLQIRKERVRPNKNTLNKEILPLESEEILESTRYATELYITELIKDNKLTQEQTLKLLPLFPKFQEGILYKIGQLVQFKGHLYQVIQEHVSQNNWMPNQENTLFNNLTVDKKVQPFIKPKNKFTSYKVGDYILWEEHTYQNKLENNKWTPAEYPESWELIS